MKLLRAGKSPKEVAWQLKTSWEDIKVLIHRNQELHKMFVETYRIRNPNKANPPPKILKPELRALEL